MKSSPRRPRTFLRPQTPLAANYRPNQFDVLCCRGKIALEHEGNHRFRELIKQHLPAYMASNGKLEKSQIVSAIVDTVRRRSPNGGFVKFVDEMWVEVGDRIAREKTGQMLRDMMSSCPKSTSSITDALKAPSARAGDQDASFAANRNSSPSVVSLSSISREVSEGTASSAASPLLSGANDARTTSMSPPPNFISVEDTPSSNCSRYKKKPEVQVPETTIKEIWSSLAQQRNLLDGMLENLRCGNGSYLTEDKSPWSLGGDVSLGVPDIDPLAPLPVDENLLLESFDLANVFD